MKNKIILKTIAIALAFVPLLTKADMLNRQLQLGMSGSDVSSLQTFLGQDRTIYPQGLVTGYFGSLTKSAVSNFQSRNGISTVGRVGPQTLTFINNIIAGGDNIVNQRVLNEPSINVSGSQATINWTTNIPTTASVYYSNYPINITEQTDYSPFSINAPIIVLHTDFRTSHSSTLTGLNANTTYYYVVYVKDVQGNESIIIPQTFMTNSY